MRWKLKQLQENNLDIQEKIANLVTSNDYIIFMKGTPDFPQCGFSAHAVKIISKYTTDFAAVNVLDDPEIRDGIKIYSSWPTIPQFYVKGEFVGGCDIIIDMDQAGELEDLLS